MTTTDFIAAIELGSSKIAGIAGKKNNDGSIQVLAYAREEAAPFVHKGCIYNIDKAAHAIDVIVAKLEEQLHSSIDKVYVGIGGQSLRTVKNAVSRTLEEESIISLDLVDTLNDENREAPLVDMCVLDVAPQEYKIDNALHVDPVGVTGQHIVGQYLNIVARNSLKKNLELSFEQAEVKIADLFVAPLALSKAVLTESEMRSTLLAKGEEIEATEGKYQAAYAVSPNQVLLITTLGKNAEGAAGNINWMIIKAGSTVGGKPTILGQSDKNGSGGSTGGGDEEEPVNIAYSDYLGEWTLTSSGRFILTDTGVNGSEEPVTFNLRIEQNVENQDYKVYGWNSDTEFANAQPFIAEYDHTEEGGISGWMNINLAQVLYTEGNIDWTLCPRFIAAQTYYYYSGTDLAFYGAILDGTVIILGNKLKFEAPIGEVQMMAMSVFGLDRTDEDADPLSLANETIHAVQPFYLTKAGASTTARKGLSTLQKSNINRLVATHQAFAQFSKAATLGKPYKRLLELAQNMPIVFNGPARKIEQPAFTKELGSSLKVNFQMDRLR